MDDSLLKSPSLSSLSYNKMLLNQNRACFGLPENQMDYSFTDLIDGNALQQLCDKFTKLTQATTAILDLDGNILFAAGWQEICTKFHRVHPETASRCKKSDTTLAKQLRLGQKYNIYKCENGLVDVVVPIIVGENHVGSLFTGQFFFESPQKEYFRQQAIEFGFNEDSYLKALSRVPVFSEEQVKLTVDFLCQVAQMVGTMGLSNLKTRAINENLEKEITERKQAERATAEALAKITRLKKALDKAPPYIYLKDRQGHYVYANQKTLELFNCTAEELHGSNDSRFFPADTVARLKAVDARVCEQGEETAEEIVSHPADGRRRIYWEVKAPIYDEENPNLIWGLCGVSTDITERKLAEEERERLITNLQKALEEIKTLRGIIPICSNCKKIRDDRGAWKRIEAYISEHSEAEFSHSICQECAKKHYPDLFDENGNFVEDKL